MIPAALTMLVIGALLGVMLGVASKVFHVELDEREAKVTEMLPGYNCGGCGYPGCSGLAAALIGKETDTVSFKPCKADRKKEIVDYLNSTPGPDGECLKVKA